MKKRPSTDFMDRVQKDVNASMRAILVDWLVEVTFLYYVTCLSSYMDSWNISSGGLLVGK